LILTADTCIACDVQWLEGAMLRVLHLYIDICDH